MVLDRDIDSQMRRTARRPLVTGVISVRQAVVFGCLLSIGSFLVLWLTANLLTALLAWSGLLFYVLVYTAWLKRSTWQNIVIGGAAGSVMPLLGWAAVTNGLDWLAGLLFLLVFLWTPVHFWALAFLVKDQYEAVGVPMAPAVLGTQGYAGTDVNVYNTNDLGFPDAVCPERSRLGSILVLWSCWTFC